MDSNTEHKIPVICLSEENFKPGSDSWVLASKQVRHGLEEYGCFEIVYDEFPLQLHNSIFGAAKDLLDLPEETKMRKSSKRPGSLGNVPQRPITPLYESIGIEVQTFWKKPNILPTLCGPKGTILSGMCK